MSHTYRRMISFGKVRGIMKSHFTFFPQIHFLPPNSPRQLTLPLLTDVAIALSSPRCCRHLYAVVASPLPTWVWVPRSKIVWVPRRSSYVFSSATAFVNPYLHFGQFNSFFFLPLLSLLGFLFVRNCVLDCRCRHLSTLASHCTVRPSPSFWWV